MTGQWKWCVAILSGALLSAPCLVAQESGGTVTGRVTDKASGAGVPQARVQVNGTTIRVVTNDSGYYRLRRVPAGSQSLLAVRLGYTSSSVTVAVTDGAVVTADLFLTAASVTLTTIQVTSTGRSEESREVATLTPQLTPDSLILAAAPNFASVLEGSAPGVQVTQPSGTTGTGAKIRIRGATSVSLSNEPLMVIDGIEVDNNPQATFTTVGVGGQGTSRVNDINPDDIETIQTLQGPAATGLYGTAAANGVIVITTKRGQSGRMHWDAFVENGEIHDDNNYPADFTSYSLVHGSVTRTNCQIFQATLAAAAGGCAIDSVASFSPLRSSVTPIRVGRRQEYNLATSGGSDVNTYFVSGDYQLENGTNVSNQLQQTNSRANFTTRPRSDLTLSFSGGYVASNTRLPQNDNDILGDLSTGLLGGGIGGVAHNYGYLGATNPSTSDQIQTFSDIQRWTPSLNIAYQPLSWLSANTTGGFDIVDQDDQQGVQPNVVKFANDPLGFRVRDRLETETYTINSNVSANAQLPFGIVSTSTVGGSWRRNLFTGNYADGFGLTGGANSLTAVSTLQAVSEINQDNRTLGGFVQQQFAWREKLYLNAGLRLDKNSSTGFAAGTTEYPTGSVAYVLSDEPWFPKGAVLSALKLRAAVGQSGLHPSFLNALVFKNPVPAVTGLGTSVAAFTAGNPGNPDLKPERTTEVETGFDLSLARDRLTISTTYFDKHTQDALVQQVLVPSIGDTNFRWINIGKVRNRGLEMQVTAVPLDFKAVNFTVTGNFTTIENRLQQLGAINGQQIQPIIFGFNTNTQEMAQGFPLGGYWQVPYTYADKNHDGIIESNEVSLVGSTPKYMGSSSPTALAGFTPSLTLFRVIKVSSLFDFQGGQKLYNATQLYRDAIIHNSQLDYFKTGDLAGEAGVIAAEDLGSTAGYIQDATFWKWREASVSVLLPSAWVHRIAARGVTLTVAARNMRTWTNYKGLDPEITSGGASNFLLADFLTQPPVRYYTFRVTLNY
jgi:TonB-dependent starch-binding outer membrane protein SusC